MCTPFFLSPQNIETQFQTNYLSHFYLTSLLLPTLQSTVSSPSTAPGTVRIVNVSSDGHAKLAPKEGVPFEAMNMESKSTWARYGMSKLGNVLHAKELARRYGSTSAAGNGILAVSLHPGTVKTGLSAGPRGSTPLYKFIQPLVELGAPGPEKGSWNSLWCAASPELKESDNGSYFLPVGKKTRASVHGEDAFMSRKLWEWSEECLKEKGF
jgi:NAD(P)-dependent dehydrogenase (short-subunit alcohol dehydrogenase family)